jgi:hypothetical protein
MGKRGGRRKEGPRDERGLTGDLTAASGTMADWATVKVPRKTKAPPPQLPDPAEAVARGAAWLDAVAPVTLRVRPPPAPDQSGSLLYSERSLGGRDQAEAVMNLPAMACALWCALTMLIEIWIQPARQRDMAFVQAVIVSFPIGLLLVLFFQYIWPLFFDVSFPSG